MNEITPVSKGILATTPFGSGLGTWWNERKAKQLESNLDAFMKWTIHHVNTLHDSTASALDRDFIESEEFEVLFIRLLESYMQARTDRKREIYKNVLLSSIQTTRPSVLLRDQYLHILDQTSEVEIDILGTVYKAQQNLPAEARDVLFQKGLPQTCVVTVSAVSTVLGVNPTVILNILWSLGSKGLTYPLNNDLSVEASVVVTPFGANFCLFVLKEN